MQINYQLTTTGWAQGTVVTDDLEVDFTVCNTCDALGDLAQALLWLIDHFNTASEVYDPVSNTVSLERNNRVRIDWESEKCIYRWQFYLQDDLAVQADFALITGLDTEGTVLETPLLGTDMPFKKLAASVTHMLGTVLKTYGFVGYRLAWTGHEFPTGHYLRLQQLVEGGGMEELLLEMALEERPPLEEEEEEAEEEPAPDSDLALELEMLRKITGSA